MSDLPSLYTQLVLPLLEVNKAVRATTGTRPEIRVRVNSGVLKQLAEEVAAMKPRVIGLSIDANEVSFGDVIIEKWPKFKGDHW